MPIVRKLGTIGNSRGVTLPKSWIEWWEKELCQPIKEVCIEMQGNTLTVYPYVPKKHHEER